MCFSNSQELQGVFATLRWNYDDSEKRIHEKDYYHL